MSVFTYHDSSDLSLPDLVIHAFEPNDGPGPDDIDFKYYPGPPLAGLDTEWRRWSFREGVPSLFVPSILDEGDEDDKPYLCRSGLIARPDGRATAYVALIDEEHSVDYHKLAEAVLKAANWGPFMPRKDSKSPVSERILILRKELEHAFAEEKPRWLGGKVDVFATHYWVQVRFSGGNDILIGLEEEGISLGYLTEVYLDVDGWSKDEVSEYVENLTAAEFEPLLTKLGFKRGEGAASSTEGDVYAGADVVGWNLPMPEDLPAVVKIVHELAALKNPLCVTLEEHMEG